MRLAVEAHVAGMLIRMPVLHRPELGPGTQLGVSAAHINALTANALVDACMRTNPRQPTPADVARLYREAL